MLTRHTYSWQRVPDAARSHTQGAVAVHAVPDVDQIHLSMDNSFNSNEGTNVIVSWCVLHAHLFCSASLFAHGVCNMHGTAHCGRGNTVEGKSCVMHSRPPVPTVISI
jgi:hypothetical protein